MLQGIGRKLRRWRELQISRPSISVGERLELGECVTVRDDVGALIARISPQGICDDCIADKLQLSVRQHANHKTRELAGTGGFERRKDVCSFCEHKKLVIRKV